MKAAMKIETAVVLTLSVTEAEWLRAIVQNPGLCSDEDQKMYKNFFYTLQGAMSYDRAYGNEYSTGSYPCEGKTGRKGV